MARFSVSEAARLLKISRKTIYKHISQGKVSAGLDPLGQKYIDAAELHRVYGDFPAPGDNGDKTETATLETVVTELRELRKAHDAVLDELKGLREDVGAGRLLEHKPSQHDEKPPPDIPLPRSWINLRARQTDYRLSGSIGDSV